MNAVELATLLRRHNALSQHPVDAYEPQAVGLNAFQIGIDGPVYPHPADTNAGFWGKAGELGRLWYERLIGGPLSAMQRVGGALAGKQPYGPVDEINLPSVIAEKQAQDVLEALGLYAGPTVAASRPAMNALSVFGGLRAKLAPREMREVAEKAISAGRPEKEVWEHTGWMRGKDGRWRFEIDDSAARLYGPKDAETIVDVAKSVNMRLGKNEIPSLKHYLKHDALFAQYPELRDVRVSVIPRDVTPLKGANAAFSDRNVVYVASDMEPKQALRSLIHEIQHWVQKKEGFARGGSASRDMWQRPELYDELRKEARAELDEMLPLLRGASPEAKRDAVQLAVESAQGKVYDRLLGEQEARTAAERLWWDTLRRSREMPRYADDAIVWVK